MDISKTKHPPQLCIYYFATENWKIDLQKLVPLLHFGCRCVKWGYPHIHAMAGLILTFLTDKEIQNGLAIHLIWSFGTYAETPDLKKKKKTKKKQTNLIYATNISKITILFQNVWKTVP